uniref:Uncharacterized protein n=1 Tax=Anguilla anguilla TaxID=7936 RepID=A0A0E9TIG7_ANGAN
MQDLAIICILFLKATQA